MYNVKILSTGKVIKIDPESDLLTKLKEEGIYIKSSCAGTASCSDCVLRVKEGEENLNTPTFEELKLLGNVFHITKERLSCQTKVTGDIEIDISMHNESSDEERLLNKTRSFKKGNVKTKVRKKDEVKEVLEEREGKRAERKEKDESWFKHWEKGQDKKGRLGGGKRPKEFRTDNISYDEEE